MHVIYAVITVLTYVLYASNVINGSFAISGKIIFEQNGRILTDPPTIRVNNTVVAKVLVKPSLNHRPNFSYSWMIDDIVFKPSFNSVIECQFHRERHSTRRNHHKFLVVISVNNTSTDTSTAVSTNSPNSELGIISRDVKVVETDDEDNDDDLYIPFYIPKTVFSVFKYIVFGVALVCAFLFVRALCVGFCGKCFEAKELKDPLIAKNGYYKIYSTP